MIVPPQNGECSSPKTKEEGVSVQEEVMRIPPQIRECHFLMPLKKKLQQAVSRIRNILLARTSQYNLYNNTI
jgi:hypothetical protein